MSYALAHPCGKNAKLVAILGNGAPCDLHAALAKNVDDCLIRQRMARILFLHELLELCLDAAGRYVIALCRGESRREKELERENTARGLDELFIRHAAHSGLVHVDHLGHLSQRERLEELHAFLEKLALP